MAENSYEGEIDPTEVDTDFEQRVAVFSAGKLTQTIPANHHGVVGASSTPSRVAIDAIQRSASWILWPSPWPVRSQVARSSAQVRIS